MWIDVGDIIVIAECVGISVGLLSVNVRLLIMMMYEDYASFEQNMEWFRVEV
jgi:hypothetical protein